MVRNALNFNKDFLKKRDAFTADEILGHNLEDVLGLGRIFDMLGYLCIMMEIMKLHTVNLTETT